MLNKVFRNQELNSTLSSVKTKYSKRKEKSLIATMHVTMSLWTHCYKYCIRIWNYPGINRILKNQISGRKRTCKNRYLEYWFSQFKYLKGFIKKIKKIPSKFTLFLFPLYLLIVFVSVSGEYLYCISIGTGQGIIGQIKPFAQISKGGDRGNSVGQKSFFVYPKSSPIIVFSSSINIMLLAISMFL